MTKKTTTIVMIAMTVLILAYDLVVFLKGGVTISEIVWLYSGRYPIMPFLGGFVCGHLFWKN